jgi:hypothetical protein
MSENQETLQEKLLIVKEKMGKTTLSYDEIMVLVCGEILSSYSPDEKDCG